MVRKETDGKTEFSDMTNALIKQMKFALKHSAELDPEAKEIVDKQFDVLEELNDEMIEKIRQQPDSKSKRETIRIHRKAKGSHFEIQYLIQQLEKGPKPEDELAQDAHAAFNSVIQLLLDYLCDITENRLTGGGQTLAQLGLFYSAIEEAYIALHLADHSFAPQSMSHTRHVLESADLITLFQKDPNYLNYWTSADYKEREKVSPANVREALGEERFDPIYSLLSEIGSHSSFKYVQTKMQREVKEGEKDIPGEGEVMNVRINLGGTSDSFHALQAYVACVASILKILKRVVDVYGQHLLKTEVEKEITEVMEKHKAFMEKHYFPILKKAGINPVWPEQK